ncbi:pyrroline-5-carboxylate reductase [Cokeromyces recurvatus]|uniref:pyrroline-5-carboxylate reductase n=1 Tax=Cokeromyces recurvatus TaxID=90255 RepID=UPI00221ED192|nr:pyrroline-5-carboxylate reductase [Cokeromyces recurvatus]KAI7899252.1 pyrroline-5-carboxylate reductase [Cokeromyces recurvatus]
MAEAVLGGLYKGGHPANHLRFSEPIEERRQYLSKHYQGVISSSSNSDVVKGADIVILAVKPQVMPSVVQDLAPHIDPKTLIVSIAAGIETKALQRWFQSPLAIVRLMPNTPALISEGAMGLFANSFVSVEQKQIVESLFGSISKVLSWVHEESMIDAVTGVSGSGPAYFFLIMEAMENAAMDLGFSREDAKALTVQTCLGAARMAQESNEDVSSLRQKVTSPNGTTEAAIKVMESSQIRDIMKNAIVAATKRSQELAKELGGEKK